jgi:hypothetical protein
VSELSNYELLQAINVRLKDSGCQVFNEYEMLEISEAMED